MGAIVDPVTGLPLVTSTDLSTIDQIPLGAQVFPYDDLVADGRPTRGPAYPDDVLPTTALVTGIYNKTAQAVSTDGENALRVYVVNESGGGGGGLVPAAYPESWDTEEVNFTSGSIDAGQIISDGNVIYGYHYRMARETGTITSGSSHLVEIWLRKSTTPVGAIKLATCTFSTLGEPFAFSEYVALTTPIDLEASFGTGTEVHVYMGSSSGMAVTVGIAIFTKIFPYP